MKLVSFLIKNYKVIDETDTVKVDPNVTALVGKNESGKTAVLKAMWKSRNVANEEFDKLYDYPRNRYSQDRKHKQVVTILEFELSSNEVDELSNLYFGSMTSKPTKVTFTTLYEGEEEVGFESKFDQIEFDSSSSIARQAIEALSERIQIDQAENAESIATAAATALDKIEGAEHIWDQQVIEALNELNQSVSLWVEMDTAHETTAIEERQSFEKIISQSGQGDPITLAEGWVDENLPVFIYFDNYGQLETRIHLPMYLKRKGNPDPRTRTQTALFEWSGIDAEEILRLGKSRQEGEDDDHVHRRLEKRRALLDSASFALTGDWVAWWNEKRHKLHFDVDGEDLVLKVSDEHNEFPIPFEERSHGFQWFFSFYLVFLVESKKAHKGAILLLDEPGLHLHPTLQTKLIELFERISGDNQLIYSTHLPFLVDGNHLERVRTVYLTGSEPKKTHISNDVRPTGDRDTLFPLQAALGYSIAQTLFIGKRSVIVEGITDYWIIKALNDCLFKLDGGPTLHEETILIPAGGTSRLMPLASIMLASTGVGEGHLMVLLDSDTQGRQAVKRMYELFSEEASIVTLGNVFDVAEVTVEDMIPRDVYVDALKQAGYNVTLNKEENAAATNVEAISQAFKRKKLGKFGVNEKAQAALVLIESWGRDPSTVAELTRKRGHALIDAINAGFNNQS